MLPPEQIQINPEDYSKESKETIRKLSGTLNNFLLSISTIFNKNISVTDNMNGEYKTVNILGNQSTTFKSSISPKCVLLASYRNLTKADKSATSSTVGQLYWSKDGSGNITVKAVTGLYSADKYELTFLILGA